MEKRGEGTEDNEGVKSEVENEIARRLSPLSFVSFVG